MSYKLFPRTAIAGISLPRMLIGTNWIMGYGHTTPSADRLIKACNHNKEAIADIICCFLEFGIDAVMGMMDGHPYLVDGIKLVEERFGKKVVIIDTPIVNVDDNEAARREVWQE